MSTGRRGTHTTATSEDPAWVFGLGSALSLLVALAGALGVLIAYWFSAPPNEGGYLTNSEALGVGLLGALGFLFGITGVAAAFAGRSGLMVRAIAAAGVCAVAWIAQASAHAADEEPGLAGHDGGIGAVPLVFVGLALALVAFDRSFRR